MAAVNSAVLRGSDENSSATRDFGQRRNIGSDDRDAGCHGLRDRDTETLVEAGIDEGSCTGCQRGQIGFGDVTEIADALVIGVCLEESPGGRIGTPAGRAGYDQVVVFAEGRWQGFPGGQEGIEVFARLDGSDGEEIGFVQGELSG